MVTLQEYVDKMPAEQQKCIFTLLPVILPTVWQSCPPLSWLIRAMTSCC